MYIYICKYTISKTKITHFFFQFLCLLDTVLKTIKSGGFFFSLLTGATTGDAPQGGGKQQMPDPPAPPFPSTKNWFKIARTRKVLDGVSQFRYLKLLVIQGLFQSFLGGGFKYFLFLPLPGEIIQFDEHDF